MLLQHIDMQRHRCSATGESKCLVVRMITGAFSDQINGTSMIRYEVYLIRELPFRTSAKISDFFTPPCPQIHATTLTKVAYYVCF